ncbi:MAG: tetratricopeptide repeat protein [Chlorobi bacterium]|nr:tetratricopeptide repeat protein [Chlorobiota bacterium]
MSDILAELRFATEAAATVIERAHALNRLAEELEKQSQYPESLAAAEEAYGLAQQAKEPTAEARALLLQAAVHLRKGSHAEALPLFEQSLKLYEELGDRSGVARASGNIGLVYNRLAEYGKALEYHTRARALHEELYNRSGIADSMNDIGIVYHRLSDYSKALEHYTHALDLHEELGDRDGVARASGNIGNVYYRLSDYSKALEHYTRALALHEELGDRPGVARAFGSIGNVYNRLSEYGKALEYYTHTIALHEELGNRVGVANVTGDIGLVYNRLSEYGKALEYFTHALALHEELGIRAGVANVTGNIGIAYNNLSEYAKALEYYTRAIALHEALCDRNGVASVTGNIGNVYYGLSEYGKALEYFTRALALNEEIGKRDGVAHLTGNIGSLYAQKDFTDYNPAKAETLLQQAITLNQELGTKKNLYENHQALTNLYAQELRWEEALQQYKKYHEAYGEVHTEETLKKAAQVEQQRQVAELEKRIAIERARAKATEKLLHKTLPPSIANRIISGEQNIADRFDSASVLFADVVGFTPMTAQMPASAVLEFMNFVFAHFDAIAAKHGCERIKTIGDGYMAVCGAPVECLDHAERIARMAMEMLVEVKLPASITEYLPAGVEFEIRIGLHTGIITGGVIGVGKLAYDIYGDTVNTASRMESHGEAGKIHVSQEFTNAVGEVFSFTERGELEVKGKGVLRTYFLEVVE